MELAKSSSELFSTIASDSRHLYRFSRTNSKSRSRSLKNRTQSSSISKFYVKNAYANFNHNSVDQDKVQIGRAQKLKQKLCEDQRNSSSKVTRISKISVSLYQKTNQPTVSISQLLEQFQNLKKSLMAQTKINRQQKILLQQARTENQDLKRKIKNLKRKQKVFPLKQIIIQTITPQKHNQDQLSKNLSKLASESIKLKKQKLQLLETDQIDELRKKIESIAQENFALRNMLSKQGFFQQLNLIKQVKDFSLFSIQPFIKIMKSELYQAKQQIKRLNLINNHLQRKSFKETQCQLKAKTSEYNQLKNKYTDLLEKYKNVRKQYTQTLTKIRKLEQEQNSMKESLNFSQLTALDNDQCLEELDKQSSFFAGVKRKTIYK